MKRWCRVYGCGREAAEGSDFCLVKHGWYERLKRDLKAAK